MSETNIITFDYLLKIVRKYFKYVLSILFSSVFLSIIYCILATPLYKSSVSIYPSYKENNMSNAMGSVLGLTNNMGFNIFDADNNNFDFQDILNSRTRQINSTALVFFTKGVRSVTKTTRTIVRHTV